MRKKTALHNIILLMTIFLIVFGNTDAAYASSVLGVTTLNEKNTAIENKYGITGAILKIQREVKSTVVLTMNGLYYISGGMVKKYTISNTISDKTSFYKEGNDVYISPILQKDSNGNITYVEVKLDLNSGSEKITTNYSEYMKKINNIRRPDSINTFTDPYHNKWFATYNSGSVKEFGLYRIDTSGNIREVEMYDDDYYIAINAYSDLSYDTAKNVYYTITIGSYNGNTSFVDAEGNSSKILTTLNRVDKDLKKKSFEVYGAIDDYKIGLKGDIWVLSGNKTLIHLDKNGKRLAKISLTDGKAISLDQNGVVYVLDDNKIKLVYQNKLYTRVTLNSAYRFHKLSMINKDNLVVYNENTFELINGSEKETIVSDSAIKTKPYMVKDNKGNITVFSKNPSPQKDANIKVYRIGSSGITFKDIYEDIGEYNKAVAYDNTIYIPHDNDDGSVTINILKSNNTIEKYVTLHTFLPIIDMQVDSKKNLYILTNQTLFKVSPTKKVLVVDLTEEKGGYQNYMAGMIKDKYSNLYVKYGKLDAYYVHTYSLLKVNDIMDIKQIKLDSGDIYADILFETSQNEIAMVKTDLKNGNKMYRINSKGVPIKDTSYSGKLYYNSNGHNDLVKLWKAADGTLLYERWGFLYKKTSTKELWVAFIDQVLDDPYGTIYYTDFSNLYIYDKQLPKIATTNPAKSQSKVSLTSKVTLVISEPTIKNSDFKNISLSANGTKVSVSSSFVDNKIVITPKAKLKAKTKYTVKIPTKAIKDLAGNTLSGDYTYTFTTQ